MLKIRCSSIGKIMTNARSKTETLSKTTISYLEEWTKEQIYSRRKEIFSKYLDKGNAVEVDSLDFIKTHLNYKQLEKNEESFENDFLTGTPDAILDDHIIDVKNSYFRSSNRVLTSIGVDNIIVVDTSNALLVAHKDRVQDIKQIVNKLKLQNHESTKLHTTVKRPWGTYTILEEGINFKIKRILVKPKASLSLQMHKHRSEHWVVTKGIATVINAEKEIILGVNESTYIPAGNKHRLENKGDETIVLIEVQTGDYLGEDDIVRFDDIYGRVV
mgnify:CR=1 FL=1